MNNYISIRNAIHLVIILTASCQIYGMKRPATAEANDVTLTKKICLEAPENQLVLDIKKNIYNFDSDAIGILLSKEEACQLNPQQRSDLHKTAKDLKKNTLAMRKLGYKIAKQTDNPAIKEKFSYDNEYKNIQKTTRYLYAAKFWPDSNFTFPQVIFTPAPSCTYHPTPFDLRIRPDKVLVALIKNEQTAIRACCYHITLESVANALIKKANSGVSVEVITNQQQGNQDKDYSTVKTLMDSGIPVLSPQKQFEQMHHKFFIFDSNICDKNLLWTGSYNPTSHGNTHSWDDANILDNTPMIKQYRERFEEIKSRSNKYVIPSPQPFNRNQSFVNQPNRR